jgi:mRNA interferase MazF
MGLKLTGVVLSDQVKSLDWQARKATLCCELPEAALQEVLQKLDVLLD